MKTERLQIFTARGWEWIFCWSMTEQKIVTTERPLAAIENAGTNLRYFRDKTSADVRAISPDYIAQ